jgi:hypothetical protein
MTKRLNDIETAMATEDNETILVGQDENGEEFTMVFNTLELLEWLDIDHMKQMSTKYISNL